jgi:hypothetical protein
MAANGTAVLALLPSASEPTPAATSSSTAAGKPNKPIETTIGEAMAAAATGLCFAAQEHQQLGALTSTTRTANGERIAALYWLQQAHADKLDFAATAREQGKVILRQYLRDDFYQQYSTEQGDAALDMFIDETLAVLARVTAVERAWAN